MEKLCLVVMCPNCRTADCRKEFDYDLLLERSHCYRCGYLHTLYHKTDDDGDLIGRDDVQGYLEDQLCIEETVIDKPFGCFVARDENGEPYAWSVAKEENYKDYVEWLLGAPWVASLCFRRFENGNFEERPIK